MAQAKPLSGRYELRALIGRGGMGEVHRAVDLVLRREVAIKTIRFLTDRRLVERFIREAHLAARFDHPNVVRIFDLGETDEGCPFLVMELLRGRRFSEILSEEGRLSVQCTAALLGGIADALDSIHQSGVVHRDIKLENLMLVECDDGTTAAKLLDFGVALAPFDETRLTVEGALIGTPLYLAPEVLLGATPSPSSDLYSLAATAYKLLTGSAPFQQLEIPKMIRAKVKEAPPPPSTLVPELQSAVDRLFARALAINPDLRPASASDFVEDLKNAAAPPPRRNRTVPLMISAGLAGLVVGGMLGWAVNCSPVSPVAVRGIPLPVGRISQ